jgi:SAM-dependent methyltransferase
MKLSEIVDYLNVLDSLHVPNKCNEALSQLAAVLHIVQHQQPNLNPHHVALDAQFNSLKNGVVDFGTIVEQIKDSLKKRILEHEPDMFRESSRLFYHEMPFETNDYILNRRLRLDDQSLLELQGRIKILTDWRLPGMMLRPGLEKFIEEMVPMDPLYLVDTHQELLAPSIQKFTVEYQRRLRPYVIDDRQPGPIMHQLPDRQFGFVFAFNFFNFRPLELIQRYLTEIHSKLRPGGSLIMTYNNCDRSHGVGLAERNWMLYTPKRLILEHAYSLGFELLGAKDGQGDLSWLELKRSGDIDSLRGGQSLAKIVA